MAKFKVIVSDPETGTSKVVELAEARASPLIGKRIGEIMDGAVVDLPGHKIQITGGSDKDGFPMRPSVHGGVRRSIVLRGGARFNPKALLNDPLTFINIINSNPSRICKHLWENKNE